MPSVASRQQRNGCSTTSTLSRKKSAPRADICLEATATNCRRLALDPANGVAAGQPRVYALALQAVAHGDGQIGRGSLSRFVAAYQSVHPLLLGELWACPIMLRLALIENLRRVAARVAIAHAERQTAGLWAERMLAGGGKVAQRTDPGRGRHGALDATADQRLCGRVRPAPAGAGRGARVALDVDGAASGRIPPDDRTTGAFGRAAAGGQPGVGEQQHRQPALAGRHRLARVRRDAQQRRAGVAGRPQRRLRADGLSAHATATAMRSRRSPDGRPAPRRMWPARRSICAAHPPHRAKARPQTARRSAGKASGTRMWASF